MSCVRRATKVTLEWLRNGYFNHYNRLLVIRILWPGGAQEMDARVIVRTPGLPYRFPGWKGRLSLGWKDGAQ